ncbi:hypothetical protein [Campylobacter troglodytis]|uniref:hypothetical protein n=1 Tax=Campylobacter troglodytis TaxID=654363 RepID=UPI00115A2ED5|nr:hypothetical protein [Campylobacter troglodytis]TQR53195.1 hypothetical protein DMC01_11790 [Campylobacter troglodytis]
MKVKIQRSILNEMSEIYTYENVDLFKAVLKQAQGKHIKQNNDLCARLSYAEAMQRLKYTYECGRDSGTNGFMWNGECNEFFEKHQEAVIAWLKEFANGLGFSSITELLASMQKDEKIDFVEDLLYLDTKGIYLNQSYTVALIVRQLVYEIACSLCEIGYFNKKLAG